MTDASVTIAPTISTIKLVERVRRSDDANARELADRVAQAIKMPDRRVGAALQPKRRGGEPRWRAERRAQRDAALRDLAATLPTGTVEGKAHSIRTMIDRYEATAWRLERNAPADGKTVRDRLRRIMGSGLKPPGHSQLKKILNDAP